MPQINPDEVWGGRFQALARALRGLDQAEITVKLGGGLANYGREIASAVFRRRWLDGKRLSDRVWDFAKITERDLIGMVNSGIAQGLSAERIGRAVRDFLVDAPPRPYTRGLTPRKRALRLARNETNKAYQSAHEMLAKESDLVKGIYLVRSGSGDPECPICNELVGEVGAGPPGDRTLYRPDQVPDRHPNCLCSERDELFTPEELKEKGLL